MVSSVALKDSMHCDTFGQELLGLTNEVAYKKNR
jgi:hypothetical protein